MSYDTYAATRHRYSNQTYRYSNQTYRYSNQTYRYSNRAYTQHMSYNMHAATRHRYSKKEYGGRTGREEKENGKNEGGASVNCSPSLPNQKTLGKGWTAKLLPDEGFGGGGGGARVCF